VKKKILNFLIFLLTLVSICAICLIAVLDFEAIKYPFTASSATLSEAKTAYLTIAGFLVCWAIAFVILVRVQSEGSFFKYKMRDTFTGIGNKGSLKAKFKKEKNNPYKRTIAYISYDSERIVEIHNQTIFYNLELETAKILEKAISQNEFVARLSNGTFGVFMLCRDGLTAQQRTDEILSVLNKMQKRVLFENDAPYRAGIFVSDSEKDSFNRAYASAVLSYKYAEENRVNSIFFSSDLTAKEESKKNKKAKFNKAIDNGEFQMFIQLLYSVQKNCFVSGEVLSRWNNPVEGFIMPTYYIGEMHRVGVIEKFDMYMLGKTCALLENWAKDPKFKDLVLSCNLTRHTLSSPDFFENFKKIFKKYSFDHKKLTLEITEDSLDDNKTVAMANIISCKENGFGIALDDFGAGVTSVSDISDYALDEIKIDREFIFALSNKKGVDVLKGFIDMAHRLNLTVVCEGVETEKQRDTVIELGCDIIQGYLYSYVLPVEEAKELYLKSDFTNQ